MFLLVEWAVSSFSFLLTVTIFHFSAFPLWLLGIIVGILTAFAPSALEVRFLPKEGATVNQIQKPLTRLLLKLRIVLRYNFARAIEICRQQDLYDSQLEDGWIPGMTSKQLSRKLRILYEACKYDIALDRGDKSFLKYDVDYFPQGKFYLLVKHLGRKKLRESLMRPIQLPGANWDGRERRKINGTQVSRDVNSNLAPERARAYDSEDCLASIKRRTSGLGLLGTTRRQASKGEISSEGDELQTTEDTDL
ncbi:MAG TPA: hypothetical protein VK582_13525 [Pyrinomonadaceae bacterium]|nr:hypothetical protein [Pyrinomonadaceae bacterium]